jgi:NAD(P)-dependent dehydrogenase (short-subunit alcohol dehydrogenase family)
VADRFLANMSEEEWDDVVRVHLKGHFVPTRLAAAWWRERSRAGMVVDASVICTTSTSGLVGNPGQSNYGAAKAGVAAFAVIAAAELAQYGVRVNAIAPLARTRMTQAVPALAERMAPPPAGEGFDPWEPANVAPLVAWLASEDCHVTGRVFGVHGGTVELYQPWSAETVIEKDGRWSPTELGYSVMSRMRA